MVWRYLARSSASFFSRAAGRGVEGFSSYQVGFSDGVFRVCLRRGLLRGITSWWVIYPFEDKISCWKCSGLLPESCRRILGAVGHLGLCSWPLDQQRAVVKLSSNHVGF